jgi:hypothetical protein
MNRFVPVSFAALAAAACAAGCGSSQSSGSSPASAGHDGGTKAPPSVDAKGCPVNSGYPGDDRCLAAPAAADGFGLHYANVDYKDPASEAPYVLAPGEETVDCYYLKSPNTTDVYVGGYQFSLRPGSHHLNVDVNTVAQADGIANCGANDNAPGLLGGTTIPVDDEKTDPAPENAGLAVHLPANSQVVLNYHVINGTSQPILREAWVNYFYMDPSQVKGLRGNVFLIGGLGFQIAPGTHQTFQYTCSPNRPTRILNLYAHMHAHSTRMTVWKVSGGQASVIYEAYNWANPSFVKFDSVHQNTPPDRATQTAGGASGQMVVMPTDSIQWECEVDNTSNTTLTFRNEVYTGEMCIVTGEMVPADDPMNANNFTCALN